MTMLRSAALAAMWLAASSATIAAQTLDFDDITVNQTDVVPDGYGDPNLLWGEVPGDWGLVREDFQACGRNVAAPGVVSRRYAAFNGNGNPVALFTTDVRIKFSFRSAFLSAWYFDPNGTCAGYDNVFSLMLNGYTDGILTHTQTAVLTKSATKYNFDFNGIDSLAFVPQPSAAGQEAYFLMDNARVAVQGSVAPEPVSMVLLGTGLAGVAGAARRRRRRREEDNA